MQFFSNILLAATALATIVAGTTVHFVNQDSTERTIVFTQNAGLESIPDLVIPGHKTLNQSMPHGWIGNWYSVNKGAERKPGMLGEVALNAFAGASYFDVSAIVNPNDTEGVKMIFPLNLATPISGCQTFPCSNAYNKWDDIATLSTQDTDLVCLLGNLPSTRRRGMGAKFSRDYVTGSIN